MAEEKELTGWERSRAAQKGYGNFYAGLAIATVLIVGIWIGSRVFAAPDTSAFGMNLWTEGISILVTVGLFGLVNQWQAERRYKRQLIDEAASTSNEVAKHAIHIIRRREWHIGEYSLLSRANLEEAALYGANLYDSNLKDANLLGATLDDTSLQRSVLENADLSLASLKQSHLDGANLRRADLLAAHMQDSTLTCANLENANLNQARLENADIRFADFQGANFNQASLQGANFEKANLQGATFTKAEFNHETRLPSGEYWNTDIDIAVFTDPEHPNFWRSDDKFSPAYIGGKTFWFDAFFV